MTVQKKHFIELSDVLALCCECKNPKCGATLVLPLSKITATESLRVCPQCKNPWTRFDPATFEPEISKFIDAFTHLRTLNDKLGFSLSLEIEAGENE